MGKLKRVVALLLTLIMAFSCLGSALASESALPGQPRLSDREGKGFLSRAFQENNAYHYADDESVRAIVVLKGTSGMSYSRALGEQTTQSAKLREERTAVYSALQRQAIPYELTREYSTLLNGFACDIAYGDLESVAALPEVDGVYIANVYDSPTTQEPKTVGSGELTGNTATHNTYGYKGQGTVVAVLDTGTTVEHKAFAVPTTDCAYKTALDNGKLHEEDITLAVAPGKYVSQKIPFAYDYADGTTGDGNDTFYVKDHDGHGSHVAGIAVGNAETADNAVTFSGAAPYAQLLAMKIFHDDVGGTSSDIYFAALEDAYRLGADVINMSIGSTSGFTFDAELETEVFGNIYKRLNQAGVVLCIAAGNEYSMAEYATQGFIGPDYTDYGTVGSPSTYAGAVSVASMENSKYPQAFITVDGQGFPFNDTCEDGEHGWIQNFGGKTTAYVVVKAADGSVSKSTPEDFALTVDGVKVNDVTGKIAVVARGVTTFEEKVEYAAKAGAVGCIVINNEDENSGMSIETFEIPAVMVRPAAGEILVADTTQQLTVDASESSKPSATAGQMSDFSNWGTSPDLTIKPTITSVGGNIWSVKANTLEDYTLMSGTSMACPNMAGTFATLLSYLRDPDGGNVTGKAQSAELATALLESTAGIVMEDETEAIPYSVRKQGAGLGNSAAAIAAFQSGAYITDPIKELGDDAAKSGVYEFSVTLKNNASSSVTYTPEAIVMADSFDVNDYGDTYNTLSADVLTSEHVTVTIDGSAPAELTLSGNESKTLAVKIELTEAKKAFFNEEGDEGAAFPYGAFIEGFINFKAAGADPKCPDIHATFLGYYGDWTAAPVLEAADFRDYLEWEYEMSAMDDGEGGTINYLDYGYTPYDLGFPVVTDYNFAALGTVSGDQIKMSTYPGYSLINGWELDEKTGEHFAYVPYNENHISLSAGDTDADYRYADTLIVLPSQLRNARHLIMTVTNKDSGKVYHEDDTEYLPKSIYDLDNMAWMGYGQFFWDGTDAEGNVLADGTVAHVQFDAELPYKNAKQKDCWSFDVTIDNEAPVIESAVYDAEAGTLTVTASDNHFLAGIYLANAYGEILDGEPISQETNEAYTATFDISAMVEDGASSVTVCALDYATNETSQETFFFDAGEDAVISLVSPAGTTRYPVKTGDTFVFPVCADKVKEDAEFRFWLSVPVEEKASDLDIFNYFDYDFGVFPCYAGDPMTVTGDATFYAIYQGGTFKTLDTPLYTYYQQPDYSGDWAIGGQPYEAGNYLNDDPYVLDENAQSAQMKTLDPDVDLSNSEYNEFSSAVEGFRFTLAKGSDGAYTVKNVKTGQYLAYVDMALVMVDDAKDSTAHWYIETKPSGHGVRMSNAANRDKVLLFDDDTATLEFKMFDDAENILDSGYHYSDLYHLWLYRYTTQALDQEADTYYTSKLTSASGGGSFTPTPLPPAPSTDEKPVEEALSCYWTDFTDCTADWYHEAVDYVLSKGLMQGEANGIFDPLGGTSRAMVATVLYRSAGSPAIADASDFTDLDANAWYVDAVAWAQNSGVVKGVSETQFAPSRIATRQELITILWRNAGSPAAQADLSAYTDADQILDFAADAMAWAVSEGILQGSNGALMPMANTTRGEFACIMMRYLEGSYACPNLK